MRHLRRLVALLMCCCVSNDAFAQKTKELGVESFIYVGARTGDQSASKGIHLFKMRTSDDPNIPEYVTVTPLGVAAETRNPFFLEIDPKRKLLFCVNDVPAFESTESGGVSAYTIDPNSGKLTLLNQRSSMGLGACHLALDRDGKHLVVANESSGNVAVFPVESEGKLGQHTDVKQHTGKSAHPVLQTAPHPRGVTFSPDNRFVFVCDFGLDKIIAYRFDAEGGKLLAHEPSFVAVKPGSGPQRMIFRPDGKFAYVINELNSIVVSFAYDAESGVLKELQAIATVPEYYDGPNHPFEIGVHPSGKCLLVSNCGHHSIVLFNIDNEKGTLSYVEDQSTYGKSPVHFAFDAAGKHVVVANEESGNILILRAPENARVKPGGNVTKTPSPTCAKFLAK